MHNVAYIAGIICGLLICVVIGVVFRLRQGKTGGRGKVEYDERQIVARGKAYKAGFFTTLFYSLLFFALSVTEIPFFQSVTGMLAGVFLGIAVFAVTAIRHDAYLGLNEKKGSFLVLGVIVTLANLVSGVVAGMDGELMMDGQLTHRCLNPMAGVLFLVIVVALLLHDRKAGEAEEEE